MPKRGSAEPRACRDLDQNLWNADAVYVLSTGSDDRTLTQVARRWHADAIHWVGGAAASNLLGDSGRWANSRSLVGLNVGDVRAVPEGVSRL